MDVTSYFTTVHYERLRNDTSFITDFSKSTKYFIPVDMSSAGSAAVVVTGMETL